MNFKPCPACQFLNPADGTECAFCGAALAAADPDDRLSLTLRPLDDPPAAPARSEPEQPVAEPQEFVVESDPFVLAPEEVPSVLDPAAAKAAHRAAVRRARLAQATPQPFPTFGRRDVLVLDQDADDREQLVRLLDGFGFCGCPARDIAEAGEMLDTQPFAAAFLNIVLDGTYQSAEAGLCRRIKQAPARVPALIVVSGQARSVDRVRAELAGADAFVVKPVGRGDVVRALDDCGVALPADSRRG